MIKLFGFQVFCIAYTVIILCQAQKLFYRKICVVQKKSFSEILLKSKHF